MEETTLYNFAGSNNLTFLPPRLLVKTVSSLALLASCLTRGQCKEVIITGEGVFKYYVRRERGGALIQHADNFSAVVWGLEAKLLYNRSGLLIHHFL